MMIMPLPSFHLLFLLFILASNLFCGSNSILRRNQFNTSPTLVFSKTSTHCLLTNSYLKTSFKTFYVGLDNLKFLDECSAIRDKWSFQLKSRAGVNKSIDFSCDQVFQRGYVFNADASNPCIHLEILVSLFSTLKTSKESSKTSKTVVLMPSVRRDWATDAFMDDDKWWMKLLKIIAEPNKILPLDSRLAAMQKIMCFKELVTDVPKVNFTRDLVQAFVLMVKQHFRINHTASSEPNRIVMSSSIPNSLVREAQTFTPVEIMNVQEMSFEDQIHFMQRATIFVGSDQMDLTLSLFLPPNGILLRVVSQSAGNNTKSSISDLLRKRGPYVEWHLEENKLQEFGEVLKKIQRHCKID